MDDETRNHVREIMTAGIDDALRSHTIEICETWMRVAVIAYAGARKRAARKPWEQDNANP